jgi:hypothetical protein
MKPLTVLAATIVAASLNTPSALSAKGKFLGRAAQMWNCASEDTPPKTVIKALVVPQGTQLTVSPSGKISTDTHKRGDSWDGTLAHDVVVKGESIWKAGARVGGIVRQSAFNGQGQGTLAISLDELVAVTGAPSIGIYGGFYEVTVTGGTKGKRTAPDASAIEIPASITFQLVYEQEVRVVTERAETASEAPQSTSWQAKALGYTTGDSVKDHDRLMSELIKRRQGSTTDKNNDQEKEKETGKEEADTKKWDNAETHKNIDNFFSQVMGPKYTPKIIYDFKRLHISSENSYANGSVMDLARYPAVLGRLLDPSVKHVKESGARFDGGIMSLARYRFDQCKKAYFSGFGTADDCAEYFNYLVIFSEILPAEPDDWEHIQEVLRNIKRRF